MRNITVNGYKRISKRTAAKLYEIGQPILFCPVKLRPGGSWNIGYIVTKKEDRTFQQEINAFEYYNCCSSATGYYTAFYIKE